MMDNKSHNNKQYWSNRTRKNFLSFLLIKRAKRIKDLFSEDSWTAFECNEKLDEERGIQFWNRISIELGGSKIRKINFLHKEGITAISTVAASVAILVGWYWWLALSGVSENTPKGYKDVEYVEVVDYKVIYNLERDTLFYLEDGSTVLLERGGELRYKWAENQLKRDVFLTGDARFDVKSDPVRPFTVFVGNSATTALGTSFSLQSGGSGNTVNVLLHHGKIKLWRLEEGNDDVILAHSGDKAVFLENGKITTLTSKRESPKPIERHSIGAVKVESIFLYDEMLVLKDAKLDDVLDSLAQIYNTEISYVDDEISNILYSGTIYIHQESAEEVLRTICDLNKLWITITAEGFRVSTKE